MTREQNCDICQKKFDNIEGLYAIKFYRGEIANIFDCPACYKLKEQEYLENYSVIIFINWPDNLNPILKWIKIGHIDCYAGKKDHNGKYWNKKIASIVDLERNFLGTIKKIIVKIKECQLKWKFFSEYQEQFYY